MAMSKDYSIEVIPEIQLESVQSVTPLKITDPRLVRRVSVANPVGLGIFRQWLHIVVYNKKAGHDDGDHSRWFHFGWLKESLARALLEQPILAGRFRQVGSSCDVGEGIKEFDELEIVSNDSGIRLIEAAMPIALPQFLHLREYAAEAKLVSWKDMDQQNPHYSPLVYVQVTRFQCGGCSIGISSSLFLADILLKENFIKKWANIHNTMLSKDDLPSAPIYYHTPNLKKRSADISPTTIYTNTSNPSTKCGQTLIFNVALSAENANSEVDDDALKHCVEEAERKFGSKMVSCLLVKTNSSNSIKVKSFSKNGVIKSELARVRSQIGGAMWDDFGVNEFEFRKGNKPACVSYWVGLSSGGFVMAIPSSSDEAKVIVTVPIN